MEVLSVEQLSELKIYIVKDDNGDEYIAEQLFVTRIPKSRIIADFKNKIGYLIEERNRLFKHPAYIRYQGVEQVDGEYCLFRRGEQVYQPLSFYLENHRLSLEKTMEIASTIGEIAREAEQEDINWRSLTIDSLWIDQQGELKFLDPDIAAIIADYRKLDPIEPEEIYRAPELFKSTGRDKRIGQTTSIYSLGVILYFLLTGETPFQVDYNSEDDKPDLVHEIINTTPLEPYYLNPSLGRELSNFVMRLLDKESSKRINNWSSYLEKIEELKKTGLSASEEEKKQHQSRSEQARKSFQRRNSIKTFWRKRWKYIIVPVVAIIIVYLITTIDSTAPYVTKDTAPGQVVKYFYQAVNEKDDVLLGQTVDLNLKHLSSMISETHVIEKMRSAYDFQQSKEGENKELFGIKNLQIVEQSTEPEPVFSAHYTFFYNMPQENSPNDSAADSNNGNNSMDTSSRQDQQFKHYEVQMNDQLKLERVNGVWKIAELKGSIDSIISGNLSDLLK